MAVSDITAPRSAKASSKSTIEDLDLQDKINANFSAAIAIIDCVKVLCALDHSAASSSENGFATGQGMANGYEVVSDSMPAALYHAVELLRETRNLVEKTSN